MADYKQYLRLKQVITDYELALSDDLFSRAVILPHLITALQAVETTHPGYGSALQALARIGVLEFLDGLRDPNKPDFALMTRYTKASFELSSLLSYVKLVACLTERKQ